MHCVGLLLYCKCSRHTGLPCCEGRPAVRFRHPEDRSPIDRRSATSTPDDGSLKITKHFRDFATASSHSYTLRKTHCSARAALEIRRTLRESEAVLAYVSTALRGITFRRLYESKCGARNSEAPTSFSICQDLHPRAVCPVARCEVRYWMPVSYSSTVRACLPVLFASLPVVCADRIRSPNLLDWGFF